MSDSQRAHLEWCATCRAEWTPLRSAIELARELPVEIPAAAHREQVRTAVLAAITRPLRAEPRRANKPRLWVALATAAIACACAVVALRGPAPVEPPALHWRSTVRASSGTRYERLSALPDEVVRVHDGSVVVDVDPLRPGERFRVLVGDAEIEVRGTRFRVDASNDQLRAVQVTHGKVDVRVHGRSPRALLAGDSWLAEPHVAATAEPVATSPARTKPPAPHRVHAVPAPAVGAGPSGDETAYNAGWDALRGSDFGSAAREFARVPATSSLADDAMYWRAVALARGGHTSEAVVQFRALLDRAERSAHFGDASAMLGWLLFDQHELDEARRRFAAAAGDRDAAARTSGQAGLAALSRGHR